VSSQRERVVHSADGTRIAYETVGAGRGLLVLGGALSTGGSYLPLAEALSESFEVHLVDRRGHGRSGPQGERYSIERETEDVLALHAQTGASLVFGHSFGGLVALEAARRSPQLEGVIVYEPGVSVAGSIPCRWLDRAEALLAVGDRRGAFTVMAQGAGFAPAAFARMPLPLAKTILRVALRGTRWAQIDANLAASFAEHRQLAAIDEGTVERFAAIRARVVLLAGTRSPAFVAEGLLGQLEGVIAGSESELIDGLDHAAPEENAASVIAERIMRGFARRPSHRDVQADHVRH